MPIILHDGPKQWNLFTAKNKGADEAKIADFLASYFDQTHDQVDAIARDSYIRSIASMFRSVSDRTTTLNALYNMRKSAVYDAPPNSPPEPPKTIFILHTRNDVGRAKMLGKQIVKHSDFDVWLDIWDPTFAPFREVAPTPAQTDLMTSLIIEMGLINSHATVMLLSTPPDDGDWIAHTYARAAASADIPPRMLGYLFATAIDDHPGCMTFDECIMHRDGPSRNPEFMQWLEGL